MASLAVISQLPPLAATLLHCCTCHMELGVTLFRILYHALTHCRAESVMDLEDYTLTVSCQ